jgi:hypothetical protein
LSTGKNVPLKNAIGMTKKLEYVAVSSWDFVTIPTITPKLAKRKQFRSKAITNHEVSEKSGEDIKPTTMIKDEAKIPFAMPASTSPVMMEEGLIGACT